MSRLKNITPDDVTMRAIVASIFLLSRGVGKATSTFRDLTLLEDRDLISNAPPPGASEEYGRLFHDYHDTLISLILDGWHRGRQIFCNYADFLMGKAEPLPSWLVEFLVWGTRDGAKARLEGCRREGRAYDNVDRDYTIAQAVRLIVDVTGLHPTRSQNPSQKKPQKNRNESGCSIVASALGLIGVNISEVAVEKIWSETKGATANLLDRPHKRRVQRLV